MLTLRGAGAVMLRDPRGWRRGRLGAQGRCRLGNNKAEPFIWSKPAIKAETREQGPRNQTRGESSKAGTAPLVINFTAQSHSEESGARPFLEWAPAT